MYRIGIDLGGTNIAAGLVETHGEGFRFAARRSIPTRAPRAPEAIARDIAQLSRALAAEGGVPYEEIPCIGVGSPGLIREGTILYSNNLQFENVSFALLLREISGKPVFLENDANAAAYGEFLCGAGRTYRSMAMVMLGTGIGSGLILDGKIYTGENGLGGEMGHMLLHPGGRRCTCGARGCFEAYCSATALAAAARRAMQQDPKSVMWELCGGDPERADGRTAFDAMRRGDLMGMRVVLRFQRDLAIGIANIIRLLQPEAVCLGGGIAQEGEQILRPLQKQVVELLTGQPESTLPRFCTAQLGGDAGILGAALFGWEKGELA